MTTGDRSTSAGLSLAKQFSLGGLVILVIGMAGVGAWVARQIEAGVVDRTAATTALYVDSLIAPPLQELAAAGTLPAEASARLDWLLGDTPLGREIAVFQVWDRAGTVVYSTVPALVGQRFPIEGELAEALDGQVAADIGSLEGEEDAAPDVPRGDLLEIYSPVRNRGTDEVIAVAEFYYGTADLGREIGAAQRRSWLVVGGATVVIYLLLAVFVRRASDTIVGQQRTLAAQVTRLTDLLRQNDELHERVRSAAARTTALNERVLRRFSAELHDGPAQDISVALLRLDHVAARCGTDGADPMAAAETERDLDLIQQSLRRALKEVRSASTGLLLPPLGTLTVAQTVDRVIRGHQRRTGETVDLAVRSLPEQAPLATKIALYRIIQEALTNAWRHAAGSAHAVSVEGVNGSIMVEIRDGGAGFDASRIGVAEEHLGLVGMRERVESLGGDFQIRSGPETGTRVAVTLPLSRTGGSDG